MDTLAFGYILPTTGRIRDFNPLETCAARRTSKKRVIEVFADSFSDTYSFSFMCPHNAHSYDANMLNAFLHPSPCTLRTPFPFYEKMFNSMRDLELWLPYHYVPQGFPLRTSAFQFPYDSIIV